MSGRSKSHGHLIGKGSIDFLIFFIISVRVLIEQI